MSLGGSPSPPPPVDQEALIRAQGEENRITQFTPLGDVRFGEVGSQGQFVPGTSGTASFIDLPPESQAIFDLGQATTAELGERGLLQAINLPAEPIDFEGLPGFSSELDFSGLQGLPGVGDFSGDAQRTQEASFQRALGLLNPEFERQQGRLDQQLANQGLPIGSEAFEGEQDRFGRIRNEALLSAARDAIGAGSAEQSRLFGLSTAARSQGLSELLQQENLARGARQQGITELTGQRSSQFAELASLLGLSQPTLPSFNAPAQIDVLGPAALAQQGALTQQQIAAQSQSDVLGGLFGLGSSALLAASLCWVAREVYGVDNPKWLVFREWMLTRAPKWLFRLYLKYGERVATWLRGKDRIKNVIRRWMDVKISEMTIRMMQET